MDGSSIRSPVEVATFSQGLGPKHPQGVFPKFGADFQRWGGSTLRSKKAGVVVEGSSPNYGEMFIHFFTYAYF